MRPIVFLITWRISGRIRRIRPADLYHVKEEFETLKQRGGQVSQVIEVGAGNETRTRDFHLGKVVLYQLSYSR